MAGLIKTALALHYRTLPPTLCDELQPGAAASRPRRSTSTPRRGPGSRPRGTKRRAAINAFGFGGINSHAILEEAPEADRGAAPGASAGRARRLRGGRRRLRSPRRSSGCRPRSPARLRRLRSRPSPPRPWPATPMSGPARLALVATDAARPRRQARQGARAARRGRANFPGALRHLRRRRSPASGKLAFVFPGEGAQYQGMLADVLMAFPEARRWFDFWDGLYGDGAGVPPVATACSRRRPRSSAETHETPRARALRARDGLRIGLHQLPGAARRDASASALEAGRACSATAAASMRRCGPPASSAARAGRRWKRRSAS